MSSCKSLKEASIPKHLSLNFLLKNRPQRWKTCSNEQKKYSMLEDDIRATTQQVMVTSQPARNDHAEISKPSNQLRQVGKGWNGQQ